MSAMKMKASAQKQDRPTYLNSSPDIYGRYRSKPKKKIHCLFCVSSKIIKIYEMV